MNNISISPEVHLQETRAAFAALSERNLLLAQLVHEQQQHIAEQKQQIEDLSALLAERPADDPGDEPPAEREGDA